jgi:hypothetical protein
LFVFGILNCVHALMCFCKFVFFYFYFCFPLLCRRCARLQCRPLAVRLARASNLGVSELRRASCSLRSVSPNRCATLPIFICCCCCCCCCCLCVCLFVIMISLNVFCSFYYLNCCYFGLRAVDYLVIYLSSNEFTHRFVYISCFCVIC